MIRVGFVLDDLTSAWLGGVNYYRNLLSALGLLAERRLHPVVFVGTQGAESFIRQFPGIEFVQTRIFDSDVLTRVIWRGGKRLLGRRNFLLSSLLARNRIDILSHFGPLTSGHHIKTIGWIPDFQHLHLSQFFSKNEIKQRNWIFRMTSRHCDRVVISSKTALADFEMFAPDDVAKARILHFVPDINFSCFNVTFDALQKKFDLNKPYFFLPNQFWAHKNHAIVVNALAELKRGGACPTIVATGNTHDYRHPSYFSELKRRIEELGLIDHFRILGVVSYAELLSLMRHSLAVINPSLFEGWSSTVEEAKLLDKTVLLSDIPVHREQDPKRGIFFDPSNAQELARKIKECVYAADTKNWDHTEIDQAAYINNRVCFATTYQAIVLELMQRAC